MAAPTKAELQARVAKLERALAREQKRKGTAKDLARARDAQAAAAKILRVIRKSPSDVQPVFEAIAEAAMRLFKAWSVAVVRFDGSQIQYGAARGARRGSEARLRAMFPQPLSKATTIGPVGRCIIGRKVIELPDARRDRSREMRKLAEARGFRSTLAVPLMNANVPIGAIAVTRVEAGRFTRAEIDLLRTFADQAVIAVENTRAFHEIREALVEQKASGEVLAAIAGSMSDAAPVFDRILEACERLFAGYIAGINVIGDDGLVHLAAYRGPKPEAYARLFPMKNSPDSATGVALATGKVLHYPDLEAPGVPRGPRESGRATGVRSAIMAPLLAEEGGIGSIYITRKFAGPFTEREIARLESFANQATIAIKNARLFNQTKEALERQTATADILKVISGSPNDVQPVFDAVAHSSMRLLGALSASVSIRVGDTLQLGAFTSTSKTGDQAVKNLFPLSLTDNRDTILARSVLKAVPAQVGDAQGARRRPQLRQIARRRGFQSIIAVPMLSKGTAIGTVSVTRREAGGFSDHEVGLLTTFADQAVIAIENVRLFNETKEALEHQTATSDVLRVISTSPTDVQPVLDVIAESAARLCESSDAQVLLCADGGLRITAQHGSEIRSTVGTSLPMNRDSATARAVIDATVVHVADVAALPAGELKQTKKNAADSGWQSILSVPLLREGTAVGAIAARRSKASPFTPRQIALLKTFADQAVIAIENVRLFNETREALERQTATAEILKVISDSPTDVQPVLQAVAERAAHLCAATDAHVWRRDGDALQVVADYGGLPVRRPRMAISRQSVMGRVVIERGPIHVLDLPAVFKSEFPDSRPMLDAGVRTVLGIPLLREGTAIGAILIRRTAVSPFSDKQIALLQTFADQAVIAIENVRLFNETKEALERQTATGEILSVISSSPTDVQPVFDTIVKNAVALSNALFSAVYRFDGERLHLVAHHNFTPEVLEMENRVYPMRPDRGQAVGRAILDRQLVHITDALIDPDYQHDIATTGGWRSMVAIPMFREGTPLGVIWVARAQTGPFSKNQLDLLRTFANQAVIAIENVRLFNETKEALERQTASAEVLQVISGSLADTQPVFEVILQSCERIFKGRHVGITLVGEDGLAHIGAYHGPAAQTFREMYPLPINRETGTGLAIIERRILHYPDTEGGADVPESVRQGAQITGLKSVVLTPLLSKDRAIGAMFVGREFAGAFSDNEIALIKTFADQAVIAIENVRLFNETKEALERQTATADILKVISGSPTDITPVLDAVAESAARLCEASDAIIQLREGDQLRWAAHYGALPNLPLDDTRTISPELVTGRAVLEKRQIHVHDLQSETADYPKGSKFAADFGYHTILATPLMREGNAIGVIMVRHKDIRPFNDKHLALVSTFADQAVIAIENVRLFNETKESLERQTATAEILSVIARSPTDVQPVFDMIGKLAGKLCAADISAVARFDGEKMQLVALQGVAEDGVESIRRAFPMYPGEETVIARAFHNCGVEHIADVMANPGYARKSAARASGYRGCLGVPMIREGKVIGVIFVARVVPGYFADSQVALLRTFADQAVIAVENVRLFNETREALERQTATAEILRVISASPTDVQPVFEAIVTSAARLCDAVQSAAVTLEDGMLHLVAHRNWTGEGRTLAESLFPMPVDRDHLTAIAVRENRVLHAVNLQQDPDAPASSRELAIAQGYDALLIVPMLREGRARGAVVVARRSPFTEHQIALLQTFADQAVIAIDNVRLFNETKEALERQTATAEILKVISGSPTDVQPVLETVAENATRLCEADRAFIFRFDGEFLRSAVTLNASPELREFVERNPIRPGRHSATARAGLEKRTIHIPDVPADPNYSYGAKDVDPIRTVLTVPMLKGDELLGVILTYRLEVKPFSDKQIALIETFADQAVIAIENVRLFNETKEALEQQRASGEVLSVISNSIADAQPVFEKIVESCERLFAGSKVGLNLVGPDGLVHAGAYGTFPGVDKLRSEGFPHPANEESATGAAILARDVIHYPDVLGDPDVPFYARRGAEAVGFRSFIMAPLLSEGRGLGAIFVGRESVGTFTEKEIALLKTFANQAVIAIQNARLFNETKEALERQTATADILKVISESPTDVQPVFDAITRSGVHLFRECIAGILMKEGDQLALRGLAGPTQVDTDAMARTFPIPFDPETSLVARTIASCEVTQILDSEAPDAPEYVKKAGRAVGFRSLTAAPLIRDGVGIGAISIATREAGFRLSEKQVSLLRTFADQAVIAIENTRLFRELQERTQALSKSVGQLTALGEVSQALSSTLDLEKVLQTIVARAVQLTGLDGGAIYEYDDVQKGFYLRGAEHMPEEAIALSRSTPMRLGEGAIGRAGLAGEAVQISDILEESYQSRVREFLIRSGSRAVVAVPLLREGKLLGALAVTRNSPGAFAPEILELLKTFATQSAIAIQNARLFREIEEKGRELQLASQHKSQFLASMSHELRTPLNAILGFNEMILGEVYGEVPADMKEPLEDIQTSGKHLLRLINNVLDLAKIEAGRMELALADYSVHDMVESVRTTLRPLAEAKGLEFIASVPNDLPLAHGDSGRLTQCLMNLAGNSLKFTKEGHVAISVEPNGETLAFRVVDTGMGIPPDKIDNLFTEFKQTDATIASEYGGTGLGLSITKKFIEMHGGRIWVESELGKGSSFIFEIPLRVETGAAA